MRIRITLLATALAVTAAATQLPRVFAQSPRPVSIEGGDWPLHNLDTKNSRYSPLSQINTTNAAKLTVKWQLDLPKSVQVGTATPVVVGGIMYFNAGPDLYAVDGATGKVLWNKKALGEFPGGGRGPAYGDGRVYATGRSIIAAFNAETGKPVEGFGVNGMMNPAKSALEFKDPGKHPADMDPEKLGYFMASSPTYANGTIYVGLASSEGMIAGGLVVAIDGATGKVKWVFRTVPQGPGDDGWDIIKDTWSGTLRQGGGVWSVPTVDPSTNSVIVNVGNPTTNYDGSQRKGSNLFTNSIVSLDMTTGKLKWYFQTIHHDIWDWDLVSGPTLFDAQIGGKTVKVVASPPKTCFVYALNRETGKPIHPIVEMAVPTATDVPGEEVYPTQPIPFTARNTAQSAFCATFPPGIEDPKLLPLARPVFTPPSVKAPILISPGATGGPNRGAGSFSPRTNLLYVTGKNDAMLLQSKSVTEPIKSGLGSPGHYQSFTEWKMGMVKATQSVAAYDPNTGDLAWVATLPGTTSGGNIATAGDLVFEPVGNLFHVLDAKTGAKLAAVQMKISAFSSPLGYMAGGKQFVAVASGNSVVAIGLP